MALDNKTSIIEIVNSVSTVNGNVLPNNKIINIEVDGSGDFDTIVNALNYLKGKACNTEVTIQLGSGTFTVPDMISINGAEYRIPKLIIKGKGIDTTILTCEGSGVARAGFAVSNGLVEFNSLSYIKPNGTTTTYYRAFEASTYGKMFIKDVKITGCAPAICAWNGGTYVLNGQIQINTSKEGIMMYAGLANVNASLTFNNVTYAISVINSGIIVIDAGTTIAKTNVSNVYNQTKNTITSNGIIISNVS